MSELTEGLERIHRRFERYEPHRIRNLNPCDRAARKTSLTSRGKFNSLRISTTRLCARLVMLLIDTSVWISVFRDRTGQVRQKLETLIDNRDVFLARFTQLELLQGSLNEKEWTLLSTYLETQDYVELTNDS